jgi:SAM-dependent methyltransferase
MGQFALGVPTDYGFDLPKLRCALSKPYLAGQDARVLDFGCGNGANTVLFAPDAAQVVGIDVNPVQVALAVRHAAGANLENVRYLLADGRLLPFDDNAFDNVVVSFEVLEHTADDRGALAEIARVMKPGAVLTMSVPNKWYLMETHGMKWRPQSIKWSRVPLLSWLPTTIHEHYANARIYTKRRILGLLDDAGFDVLQHRYIMPPFDKVNRPRAKAALRKVFDGVDASPLRVIGVAHFVAARLNRPASGSALK